MDVGKNTVKGWRRETSPYSSTHITESAAEDSEATMSKSSLAERKSGDKRTKTRGRSERMKREELPVKWVGCASTQELRCNTGKEEEGGGIVETGEKKKRRGGEINISATWPLKPLPMTANIMKRYGSREGERNEKDKKRTVK